MHFLLVLDQIDQIVERAPQWMGKCVINEEEFFVLIQQLRTGLPQPLKNWEYRRKRSGNGPGHISVLRIIDEIEEVVENGESG